jgi:hypothetical protein
MDLPVSFSKSTSQSSSIVQRHHPKSVRHHNRPDPPAANETATPITTTKAAPLLSFQDDEYTSIDQQPWRQYGHIRRQWLIENDKATSSLSFRINSACSIQKYFALAERVRWL